MIIKVAADRELLQEGGCDVKELVWTLGASQAFLVAVPALKKQLRIVTITSGFTEHGYDLYTVRHTQEGPVPDRLIDITETPDMYGMRSGSWVYVKRLPVSMMTAVLTKEVVKCGEPFEVLVRATDSRNNARPLPSGGRVRLFPKLLNPTPLNSSTELLGDLTQGTGDGRQVEFHFSGLRIEHSGKYIIRTEHTASSGQTPVDPGSTKILTVSSEPFPTISVCSIKNIGVYAFEFRFVSSHHGHFCYMIFRKDNPAHKAIRVQDIKKQSSRAIDIERNKGAMLMRERGVEQGEGCSVVPGCLGAGILDVIPGLQTAQVVFKPIIDDTYVVLAMTDNCAGTNPNEELIQCDVLATESHPLTPLLTNTEVQSTPSGKGGLKFTFDASEAGNIHYIVTLENVYHPVEAEEVITDVKNGTQVYGMVASGSLSVGRGLGHSTFLFVEGLEPGVLYDFWWAAEPLQYIEGVHRKPPPQGAVKLLPPPERLAVVVPYADPPHITSFSLLPVDGRLAIRVHFETDCPGTVYFMLVTAGRGHLITPAVLTSMVRTGLPDARPEVISVCKFAALSSGPHSLVVSHPVPKELTGAQFTQKLEPETAYEGFFLSDNTMGNNPGLKISQGYPVVLPEVIELAGDMETDEESEEPDKPESVQEAIKAVEFEVEEEEAADSIIGGYEGSERRPDLEALQSLFSRDVLLEDHTVLPYHGAAALQDAFANSEMSAKLDARMLRDQFVYTQQRVLDLETTLSTCKQTLGANLQETGLFAKRLKDLQQELNAKKALKKGLEKWKAEHNDMVKEQVLAEKREIEKEIELVLEGNRQWEERVQETEECNKILSEMIEKLEQKRKDFIKSLEERCVYHKTELKRSKDRMDEVLALRKVKEEQDFEIAKLTERIDFLVVDVKPEQERTKEHRDVRELEEPEPSIITRALVIPKGGLRVLTTVNGTGLQALRFQHHVNAEVVNVGGTENELRVTGESSNVLQFIKEIEEIYEELKRSTPGPPRAPIF